jgi:hypothetical protein
MVHRAVRWWACIFSGASLRMHPAVVPPTQIVFHSSDPNGTVKHKKLVRTKSPVYVASFTYRPPDK